MNAHLKTVEGRDALITLQRDTEAAVHTRSDLDTPAGARDFQRFLIGKLRDIRAVVMNASLDDTSKSALMAAWTSLYDASKTGSGDSRPAATATDAAPARGVGQPSADVADAGTDPLLDSLLAEDPALLGGDVGQGPAEGSPATAMPAALPLPSIPNLGAAPLPAGGTPAGWGTPGGFPLPARQADSDAALTGLDGPAESDDPDDDKAATDDADHDKDQDPSAQDRELPPTGPTTVTLA